MQTPQPPLDALREAVDLAAALTPPPALAPLRAWLDAPATVAVVGPPGVGKTSLVAALVGGSGPTPGPPTRTPHPYPAGPLVWVDTPGLDDPAEAAPLRGVLAGADVVVWVVDGLRPAGEQERRLLTRWARDKELRVFVSRADLLPDGAIASVLDRVRALPGLPPRTVLAAGDARRPGCAAELSAPPSVLSAARRAALTEAAEALEASLARHPGSHGDAHARARALHEAWRASVSAASEAARAELPPDALHDAVTAAVASALVDLRARLDAPDAPWAGMGDPAALALPAPRLPAPPGPLQRAVSGRAGARRALLAALAEWHLEGRLALDEWLGAGRALPEAGAHERWRRAADALTRALAALRA